MLGLRVTAGVQCSGPQGVPTKARLGWGVGLPLSIESPGGKQGPVCSFSDPGWAGGEDHGCMVKVAPETRSSHRSGKSETRGFVLFILRSWWAVEPPKVSYPLHFSRPQWFPISDHPKLFFLKSFAAFGNLPLKQTHEAKSPWPSPL